MKKLILALAAAATLSYAAPDPNFHIYIAYGQSNMGGTADAQAADKVENPRFKIFASQKCSGKGRNTIGAVYPAVPSLFNCGNTISVADWFGRTMLDSLPDVTIGIVPVAVGGASIKLFDQEQYKSYLSTADGWLVDYAKEYASDGNVMKVLIDIAKKAQEVGVIKGIIFHQGETDGPYPDWPQHVKKTRDDILKALNLSSDTVPFVAGELLRGGCCYSDRVSKLPNIMDNTYFASSEGLDGNGRDRYHFSHDAYVTIGKRYAEQMLKAINRVPVEPVPQEPFGSVEDGVAKPGTPAEIPGKIEAENYDITGVGSGNASYKDEDSENKGGEYRKDGVDIEKGGDNFVVGYTMAGEWMEYTVNASFSGEFDVIANVASGTESSSFELFIDDQQIGSTVNVPKTGDDWKTFRTVEIGKVKLTEGKHVLKIAITGNYVNIDWVSFENDAKAPPIDRINGKYAVQFDSSEPQKFRVFSMTGKVLGIVEAPYDGIEMGLKAAGFDRGAYLVQSASGITRVVQFAKP